MNIKNYKLFVEEISKELYKRAGEKLSDKGHKNRGKKLVSYYYDNLLKEVDSKCIKLMDINIYVASSITLEYTLFDITMEFTDKVVQNDNIIAGYLFINFNFKPKYTEGNLKPYGTLNNLTKEDLCDGIETRIILLDLSFHEDGELECIDQDFTTHQNEFISNTRTGARKIKNDILSVFGSEYFREVMNDLSLEEGLTPGLYTNIEDFYSKKSLNDLYRTD